LKNAFVTHANAVEATIRSPYLTQLATWID